MTEQHCMVRSMHSLLRRSEACANETASALDMAKCIHEAAPQLIHAKDNAGFTVMHWAVASKNIQLVLYLCSCDSALLVEFDNEGHTPLMNAVVNGNIQLASSS